MSAPRFTVLLPTHNRADLVGIAIASVLAQTEPDFELLVVGDGCTDDTAAVVASFADGRIRWFDLPKAPGFGYANRNVALREARGTYVAFAPHDDILFPDHLVVMARRLEEDGKDWAYSRPLWVTTDGVIVPFAVNLRNEDERRVFLTARNSIPAGCVVHRRSGFERFGYWPETIRRASDWHLWRAFVAAGVDTREPTPTMLHFTAPRTGSRYAGVPLVAALLSFADRAHWWPPALRCAIPPGQLEQVAIWAAMQADPAGFVRRVREAATAVIDRIAWDVVRKNASAIDRGAGNP